jgi:hypothetical protein
MAGCSKTIEQLSQIVPSNKETKITAKPREKKR